MSTTSEIAPQIIQDHFPSVAGRVKSLRMAALYIPRPDFRSLVDMLENVPGLTDVMSSLNVALSISGAAKHRHDQFDDLYRQREISIGWSNESSAHLTQRERALVTQIIEVRKRLARHCDEHLEILREYGTVANLNSRQQALNGRLKALDFIIDHQRSLRSDLLGDSVSLELDEVKCMKRYAAAQQANELSRQQVAALEADIARLKIKYRPYPSLADVSNLEKECADLDTQVKALEAQISQSLSTKDSEAPLRETAASIITELIGQLSVVQSEYSSLCDSKMERLSSLIQLHEKKLKLYRLQREYVDEFGDKASVDIDFESNDIESDKFVLGNLHKEVGYLNDGINVCISRIHELKHILSTLT